MKNQKQSRTPFKVQVWIIAPHHRFLVLKMIPERGGFWQPVTGGVESGESPLQAALREAQEETGLEFRGPPQKINFEFSFSSRFGTPVSETCFWLETVKEIPPQLDPREHLDFKWCSFNEALNLIHFESNKTALKTLHQSLTTFHTPTEP